MIPVDREQLRDRVLYAMYWAGHVTAARPPDTAIAGCLRSDAFARDAVAVFPNGQFSVLDDAALVAMGSFSKARRAIADLRQNPVRFTWQEAEAELTRARSLLLFSPAASPFDGAAVPDTHGFINDDYFPPWDTWLDLLVDAARQSPALLLSWVPRWAGSMIDLALSVDPAGCMSWAEVVDGKLFPRGWGQAWEHGGSNSGLKFTR